MNLRRFLKYLSLGLVAFACLYFFQEFFRRFSEIPDIDWNFQSWMAALLSAVLVGSTSVLGGAIWRRLLVDHRVPIGLGKAIQITAVSQIGKYLPGNVGHLIGRATLAFEAGVGFNASLAVTLQESLWYVVVGSGLVAVALMISPGFAAWFPFEVTPAIFFVLSFFLLMLPVLGIPFFNWAFPKLSRRLGRGNPIPAPTLGTSVIVGGLVILCYGFLGAALYIQARWLFHVDSVSYVTVTTLFGAAWLAGYVVPGAPGGLGVREALMVFLFSPLVGAGPAVALSMGARLAGIVGDALSFAFGLLSRRYL